MLFRTTIAASLALALSASVSIAASIFSPTDTIYGGVTDGTDFTVGDEGCCNSGENNWPGSEGPENAINGVGQKYLNFAVTNAGFVITPGAASLATSLQIWTANDAEERDPTSYALYGTNEALGGGAPGNTFAMTDFMLISAGALALPSSRNLGGNNPLDDISSQTVSFANTTSYTSYMLIFPTVKDSNALGQATANSMQIAEAQLFSGPVPTVPLPAALPLLLVGLGGLGIASRRRKHHP